MSFQSDHIPFLEQIVFKVTTLYAAMKYTDGYSGLTPKDIFIAKKILGQRLNSLFALY